jgi:stage III sporulation protein SpoIIIAA
MTSLFNPPNLVATSFVQLVEVVMDLGRPPLARFADGEEVDLGGQDVTREDLTAAVALLGSDFDADNRAGIDATLHRISAMRNRVGNVVGLTCRAGRAVEGSASMVADLARAGKSILLLGRPGG